MAEDLASAASPLSVSFLSRGSAGWRMRALVVAALLGCFGLFALPRMIMGEPHIDASWRVDSNGRVHLRGSHEPALQGLLDRELKTIRGGGDQLVIEPIVMEMSGRWLSDDEDRRAFHADRDVLGRILASPEITLEFADGTVARVPPRPMELRDLTATFWVFTCIALVAYLLAAVVSCAAPSAANLLYAVMMLCQVGNLLFIAVESTLELGTIGRFAVWDSNVRVLLDLVCCAAAVHRATMQPARLPRARLIGALAWLTAGGFFLCWYLDTVPNSWWWAQGGCTLLCVVTILMLSWSYRRLQHPMSLALRRMLVLACATWVLLTVAIAATDDAPGTQLGLASVGTMIWYVFLASVLGLVPFMGRSKLALREFALIAATSTIATSLDLLFVAVFPFSQFTSVALSLFISIGLYLSARQWLLSHVTARNLVTTERMFERLYRTARAAEAQPQQTPRLLAELLRDIFDPMQVIFERAGCGPSRVETEGAALRVRVPQLGPSEPDVADEVGSIVVRFASRGRRLFTPEDARLTDRVVDQLRRAVAFDRAVEQGRAEERARIAQDLHDDIGARLLTLMYKASSPEMEDYVRHTLQDLKTLTRGLAAPHHRLSHAAAEWKADLAQRLAAARIELEWHLVMVDGDILLSVVQWSALTRILRELCSNIMAHAHASTVRVHLRFFEERLEMVVRDDGQGRNPRAWAHGLGLGGVRKRARQLGGDVEWSEVEGGPGIICRVSIRQPWQRV